MALAAKKKGRSQQPADRQQVKLLGAVPDDLQGVEGDPGGEGEGGRGGNPEEPGQGGESGGKAGQQPLPGEAEESAAGAVAEEGHGNDHVGEMMPLLDGKHPHEQDLERDGGRRKQENGGQARQVNDRPSRGRISRAATGGS